MKESMKLWNNRTNDKNVGIGGKTLEIVPQAEITGKTQAKTNLNMIETKPKGSETIKIRNNEENTPILACDIKLEKHMKHRM